MNIHEYQGKELLKKFGIGESTGLHFPEQTAASLAAAVQAFVRGVVAEFGSLSGILHGAGVLRDSFVLNKQPQDLHAVLAPKVNADAEWTVAFAASTDTD